MEKMDVNVQMVHTGMETGVRMLDVLVANTMMGSNVYVRQARISMAVYAYFVSTDNCGIKHLNHVFALSIIHGMEIGVKNQSYAQEIEYGILSITNACVEMDNFGTALFANGKRIVLEVKNGIQKHILAHALIVFIGMVKLVFFV